jgi:hypothetical protein
MPQECADMTRNTLVTALGFGVLAFISLTLYATAAECPPGYHWTLDLRGMSHCVPDRDQTKSEGCKEGYRLEQASNGATSCVSVALEKVLCDAKGANYRYDSKTGSCIKTIAKVTPETCEAKGPNYHFDPQTGRCIKTIAKIKPPVTSGGVGGE